MNDETINLEYTVTSKILEAKYVDDSAWFIIKLQVDTVVCLYIE